MISVPLDTIAPFKDFSDEIRQFFQETGSFRRASAKEVIFSENEPSHAAFMVISGRVAMQKPSPNGRELIFELIFPNELFGIVGLLDNRPYPLTAKSQSETAMIYWDSAQVRERLKDLPDVRNAFSDIIFQRLRHTQELARAIAHDDVETRVGAVLTALFQRLGTGETLPISRQEIADLCAITLETASRVIKQFERQELLDASSYGQLIIPENSPLRA